MTLQADLAEATMLRQRQEETLRLRERELTALKGALKEEVECHDKEMEDLKEQYSQDMDSLRSTMEEFTQVNSASLKFSGWNQANSILIRVKNILNFPLYRVFLIVS